MVKVAIVTIGKDVSASFQQALQMIGGIDDLNTPHREVLLKVGVFEPKQQAYTSVPVTQAIIEGFGHSPKIWMIESDNYRGTGTERLQIWKDLFSDRIVPYNLSEETQTKTVKIGEEEMQLSHLLFEDRVLISTHTLRKYSRGSIIKNLFGLPPMRKKAVYHKNLENVILDLFEAVGGIDLAVIDGTYAFPTPAAKIEKRIPTNVLVVGRDAVAVDAVGFALFGKDPQKMPIIQKAMDRGLGEGNFEKIEVVGNGFEELQAKIVSALKKK